MLSFSFTSLPASPSFTNSFFLFHPPYNRRLSFPLFEPPSFVRGLSVEDFENLMLSIPGLLFPSFAKDIVLPPALPFSVSATLVVVSPKYSRSIGRLFSPLLPLFQKFSVSVRTFFSLSVGHDWLPLWRVLVPISTRDAARLPFPFLPKILFFH